MEERPVLPVYLCGNITCIILLFKLQLENIGTDSIHLKKYSKQVLQEIDSSRIQ